MFGEAGVSVSRPPVNTSTSYESYHKIHKRLVGPATADKLVNFFEILSQAQQPREMYVAGWAAAEAALVGTQYSTEQRTYLAQSAKDCWEYGLVLEQERAANVAWHNDKTPDCSGQYRIASTLALAPLIEAIPKGVIPKNTLRSCQEKLLEIADANNNDMQLAMLAGSEGRASNHMGVAYEQIATLGVNRKLSSRIVGIFSLARSGTGYYYPQQTHDLMLLNLHKNKIVRVTPTEVKSRLKVKFSNRYEAALVGGKAIVGEDRQLIGKTIDLLKRELAGDVTTDERTYLESISDSIIHSVRHHHRAETLGRHCLSIQTCALHSNEITDRP